MPGGDGTGPMGLGSMTGRGVGFCTGFNIPGFLISGTGRRNRYVTGFGYGRIFLSAGLLSGCAYLIYRYLSQKTNKI